ncbi:hypothetical protein [uncultured Microbacterium sp.]|uniref:hypothetical protein n=1 Tax=uncultured Microbacterium sp. TaxID=191216 RepID=UPI0028E35F64|nr:hypothetical protein [uncultured Microbacterium sp.]
MKLVSYAGQQLITSDDVAETLLALAAAIAREGESEAVEIPILLEGEKDWADLLVGVGNDVLVSPHHTGGTRSRLLRRGRRAAGPSPVPEAAERLVLSRRHRGPRALRLRHGPRPLTALR